MLCRFFLCVILQIQNSLTHRKVLSVLIVKKIFLYFIWNIFLFHFHSFVLVWLGTTKHPYPLQCMCFSAVWRHFSGLPWSSLFPAKYPGFLGCTSWDRVLILCSQLSSAQGNSVSLCFFLKMISHNRTYLFDIWHHLYTIFVLFFVLFVFSFLFLFFLNKMFKKHLF